MSRSSSLAVAFAAAALAGCEGPLVEQELSFVPLQGEWIACLNDGAGDYSAYMLFFPDASFRATRRTYETNDRTCGGPQTSVSHVPWTYELLGSVPARIGTNGSEVVASQMNLENTFERVFTIVYVDGQSTPNRLYLGDLAHDPARDGTSPERRPTVLSDSAVFTSE